MVKAIRVLEVPLLLLIMAIGCVEENAIEMAVFLGAISITRLIVNVITDSIIYRRQ